jgi:RNA polymerase sigma-70 factor (ECF subfamily)
VDGGHEQVMKDDAEEDHFWARVMEGDDLAFGVVFRRYSDAVYNHCFRRTADWSAAEDLTSLVFLQAWRRRQETVPEAVLPWLLGIANQLLRNHVRSQRRNRALVARLSAPGPNRPELGGCYPAPRRRTAHARCGGGGEPLAQIEP